MLSKDPVTGLEILMDTGLMAQFLPEMLDMVGENAIGDPIWHPEGLAWVHTLMVIAVAAKEKEKSFEFMLGVFLHDIAKPRTAKRPMIATGISHSGSLRPAKPWSSSGRISSGIAGSVAAPTSAPSAAATRPRRLDLR